MSYVKFLTNCWRLLNHLYFFLFRRCRGFIQQRCDHSSSLTGCKQSNVIASQLKKRSASIPLHITLLHIELVVRDLVVKGSYSSTKVFMVYLQSAQQTDFYVCAFATQSMVRSCMTRENCIARIFFSPSLLALSNMHLLDNNSFYHFKNYIWRLTSYVFMFELDYSKLFLQKVYSEKPAYFLCLQRRATNRIRFYFFAFLYACNENKYGYGSVEECAMRAYSLWTYWVIQQIVLVDIFCKLLAR